MHRPTIVFTLHELGQGGTDRVCAHLANGFAAAGYHVKLIVLFGGSPNSATIEALLHQSVEVCILDARRGSRNLGRVLALRQLVNSLKAITPNVVLSSGNNMNWLTALAFRLAHLRDASLVLKITNPIIRGKDGFLRRIYRRARYRHAFAASDAILTLSECEAGRLKVDFPQAAKRIRAVVNPYVTPNMLAPVDDDAVAKTGNLVLAIGRLEKQKQFDLLIRAFALLDLPEAQLTILGEGRERSRLEALIQELGLEGRVSLPGYKSDIKQWLKRSRLLALSSRYEGLPAVVLEAMAVGCHVVSTDCFTAAQELVEKADGCTVVSEATPEAFAEGIMRTWCSVRSPALAEFASRYSVEEGTRSHIAVVCMLAGLRSCEPLPAS